MTCFTYFIIFLCVYDILSKENELEVNFESFNVIPDIDDQNIIKVQNAFVKKLNRSMYGLTFEMDALQDFDGKVTMTMDLFHSRLRNSQYIKSAVHIPSTAVCEFLNSSTYRDHIMNDIKNVSNFQQYVEGENTCPMKKGFYFVRNLILNGNQLPQYISSGLWKIEVFLYYENIKIMGSELIVNVFGNDAMN